MSCKDPKNTMVHGPTKKRKSIISKSAPWKRSAPPPCSFIVPASLTKISVETHLSSHSILFWWSKYNNRIIEKLQVYDGLRETAPVRIL